MTANDLAAQFIASATWDHLPAVVQEKVRMCLVDSLGAALAGTLARMSQIGVAYAAEAWPGDEATILLDGTRSSATGAAFANACAADALDLDGRAIFTRGHLGALLLPTALAVGEESGASGKMLLEALVIGYEVGIRAGRCWHDDHEMYQSSGSWGSLACAAIAARLRRLDHTQVKHALGIADYHAPNAPVMSAICNPAMVRQAAGWGAMNGVVSAELAQRGFTGIPSLLGFDAYREWVLDIGERYWLADWVTYDSGIVERGAERWGQAMLEDKFRWLAGNVLPSETITHLIELVRALENLENVRQLTQLLL